MLVSMEPQRAPCAPAFGLDRLDRLEEARRERFLRRIAVREAAWRRDRDGDGVPDVVDNCPDCYNPNQCDFDLDGLGDCCDWDDDNDGEYDNIDPAPHDAGVWTGIPRCAVGLYGPTGYPGTFHCICAGQMIDLYG